ncbi:hypothetical protein LPB04_23530 (plasmid) [Massilia litorea]|uniref:Right handed beta helix domain-containing protein n=1 Tax=Massilia litorea TaxID=2769491 RepID=A0A7L9UBP6_9BURK|nr:hypothetical protein LPB04_23530 [Massilia litorea]
MCRIDKSNLTIRGVNGRPKIDAAGMSSQGKAIWVIGGNNVVVENIEMFGASVPDQNGSALRLEGTNFTLRNSFLHDNENGILSGVNTASTIVLENNEFGYNGYGNGYSHNVYIGKAGRLIFRFNYSHDANVGHNLKTRALVNTISYNRFSSLRLGETGSTKAGKPSYEIDIPNGGTTSLIGNVIMQPVDGTNRNIVAYGEEGIAGYATDLYIVNNTFINDERSRGTFIMVGAEVKTSVVLINNLFSGYGQQVTQPSAIKRTNYQATSVNFVNKAAYDLRPLIIPQIVNAGSEAGYSTDGTSLDVDFSYRHIASADARIVLGARKDIGAYEVY